MIAGLGRPRIPRRNLQPRRFGLGQAYNPLLGPGSTALEAAIPLIAYPLSPGLYSVQGIPTSAADVAAMGIPIAQNTAPTTMEDPCSDYDYLATQAGLNVEAARINAANQAQGNPNRVQGAPTSRPGPTIPILQDNTPLANYMNSWVTAAIANPAMTGQTNPTIVAHTVAGQFCANPNAPPGFTTAASPQASTPVSPAQADNYIPPGAITTPQAPVVVNPSPPSQPVTTGSSVTAPASTTSVANGTSLQTAAATTTTGDIIAGIPNEWLIFGAAGLALVLVVMAQGR